MEVGPQLYLWGDVRVLNQRREEDEDGRCGAHTDLEKLGNGTWKITGFQSYKMNRAYIKGRKEGNLPSEGDR